MNLFYLTVQLHDINGFTIVQNSRANLFRLEELCTNRMGTSGRQHTARHDLGYTSVEDRLHTRLNHL